MTVVLRAHAKVNLFLAIEGARDDGFHDLTSVFHALDLADDVSVRPGSGVRMTMEVLGEVAESDNLAARALEASGAGDGFGLDIQKRIPVAAGLGGGSADAAAAFLAGRVVSGRGLDDHHDRDGDLEVGAGLGSDVPFFLTRAGTAIVRGRGERVTPLAVAFQAWFVLGLTHAPLTTADVYARWDDLGGPVADRPLEPVIDAMASDDVAGLGALLHNDLEAATFDLVPALAGKKEAMIEAGAYGALVAGSGPTLFGLAGTPEAAHEVAGAVAPLFDRVHVCHSAPQSIERVR